MADKRPIVDPADLEQIQAADRLEVESLIRQAGDMVFQDGNTGPHTLTTLASGGGGGPHAATHEVGGGDEIEIANLTSVNTETGLALVPDGSGGVEFIQQARKSGVFTGGLITAGTTGTVNITSGTGLIDRPTAPANPTITKFLWSAATNLVLANIATADLHLIFVNAAGSFIQRTQSTFSEDDHTTLAFLGYVFTNDPDVTLILSVPSLAYNGEADFRQFLRKFISPLTGRGNDYSAGGADLTLQRSAGEIFATGINFHNDAENPSVRDTLAVPAPITFNRHRTDGSGGLVVEASDVTTVDPTQYEPNAGGSLSSVGSNRWTIQRIFILLDGGTSVLYGQERYNTLNDALVAITTEPTVIPPLLELIGSIRTNLIVIGNATDLSDSAQAVFVDAGGGILGGGGGGGGVSSLGGEFFFAAARLGSPSNSDFVVSINAPLGTDPANQGILVRKYDDTTEEASYFTADPPEGATNLVLIIRSKAQTAATAVVKLQLYTRELSDTGTSAWTAAITLGDVSIPNTIFYQTSVFTIPLATLSMTPGGAHQLLLTRTSVGDTLSGDWLPRSVGGNYT